MSSSICWPMPAINLPTNLSARMARQVDEPVTLNWRWTLQKGTADDQPQVSFSRYPVPEPWNPMRLCSRRLRKRQALFNVYGIGAPSQTGAFVACALMKRDSGLSKAGADDCRATSADNTLLLRMEPSCVFTATPRRTDCRQLPQGRPHGPPKAMLDFAVKSAVG